MGGGRRGHRSGSTGRRLARPVRYDGGKRGEDYSWVVPIGSPEEADALCADPTQIQPDAEPDPNPDNRAFLIVAGDIRFRG